MPFTIAKVLAGFDPKKSVGGNADRFALEQILIERSLIAHDDGWVVRGARSYRGRPRSKAKKRVCWPSSTRCCVTRPDASPIVSPALEWSQPSSRRVLGRPSGPIRCSISCFETLHCAPKEESLQRRQKSASTLRSKGAP
jgi:hypothetical protein